MKRHKIVVALSMLLLVVILSACGSKEDKIDNDANVKDSDKSMFWLQARTGNEDILGSIRQIAEEFQEEYPGFELEIDGTGDRPTYLQNLRTLIASDKMPDMFDTDPDTFTKKLVDSGGIVNIGEFLEEEGKYDDYASVALKYQQFDDGSLYTLPIEYNIEMFFYNKEIFKEHNITPPETMDELFEINEKLQQNDVTPIAMGGVDKWTVLRYLAFMPFRETGNEFLSDLVAGDASMSDPVGMRASEFVQDIGQYFQEGFSSTDYTTARQLFSSGQTAMYYMGSWEIMNIINDGMDEDNLGYFTLPTISGAATQQNEYFAHSGIGLAFNQETFDDTSKEFVKYLIERYPEVYSQTGQFSPIKVEGTEFVTDLHTEVNKNMESYGDEIAIPWDTRLDPASNEEFGNQVILLANGSITSEEFAKTVEQVLQENAQN